jgi:large subunit ribosomal protein L3
MQINSLIGKKISHAQGFLQNGKRVPLTAVNVMGNVITQVKTEGKEGYNALQIGRDFKNKALKRDIERAKKAGLEKAPRFFKEIRVETSEGVELGSQIDAATVFAPGDIVDVTGVSKGKGWAGGVKRHGFKGGPRTHGQSDRERAPGSIGQTTTPGRVYKGKRMAGRMGTDNVTVKNLEVIEITPEGVLLIKGLVPGNFNGYLTIKKVGENKKFVSLYKEPQEETAAEEVQVQDQVQEAAQEEKEETAAEVAPQEEVKTEAAEEQNREPEQNDKDKDKKEPTEEVEEDAKS